MADPKYANLYGIAHDQPDVYETSDLPEADQPPDIFEEKSDAVERLHISALEAFSKFQGKELDAATVDFSDHVGKNRANGYNIRSINWELSGPEEKETPFQKYNRLKLEAEHLFEEVSTLSKNTEKNLSQVTDTLGFSVDAVNQLCSKITEVKLQDKIGLDFASNVSHPEQLHFVQLLNQLDRIGNHLKENPLEIETSQAIFDTKNAAHCIFPLKPNQQMHLTSRITEIEQKISKLEMLIGSNTNQVVRLCNVNPDDGLINCSQWMVAKLSLLDSNQLDAIESRINNVNSRTDQFLNTQNSLSQDPEKQKKINELYELSNKAREKSNLIPAIVDRMIALETIHQQGKQSAQTISHLENLQSELSSNLANNNVLLNEVKENMRESMALIKENINSLKTRVEALLKR